MPIPPGVVNREGKRPGSGGRRPSRARGPWRPRRVGRLRVPRTCPLHTEGPAGPSRAGCGLGPCRFRAGRLPIGAVVAWAHGETDGQLPPPLTARPVEGCECVASPQTATSPGAKPCFLQYFLFLKKVKGHLRCSAHRNVSGPFSGWCFTSVGRCRHIDAFLESSLHRDAAWKESEIKRNELEGAERAVTV